MRNSAARTLAGAVIVLVAVDSAADTIYQCRNESGQVIFSNTGCEDSELIDTMDYTEPEGPSATPFSCPSGISAVANNVHYPSLDEVDEAVRLAESDHTNFRYRKLIKEIDPEGVLPDRVSRIKAEAFPASEVPGFSDGVVVNVRICK